VEEKQEGSLRPWPVVGAAVMGIVGFVCGYRGPFWIQADPGYQAPLLGIFFTGPIGIAIGVPLGCFISSRRFGSVGKTLLLLGAASIWGIAILAAIASDYSKEGRLVEVNVLECGSLLPLVAEKMPYWRAETDRLLASGERNVRKDWEGELGGMLSAWPGVALKVQIVRQAWIKERRWKGGRILRTVGGWRRVDSIETVFAPEPNSECNRFEKGAGGYFYLDWEVSAGIPPSGLPDFLRLWVLRPVPEEFVDDLPKR
jgi:hypothetical protein